VYSFDCFTTPWRLWQIPQTKGFITTEEIVTGDAKLEWKNKKRKTRSADLSFNIQDENPFNFEQADGSKMSNCNQKRSAKKRTKAARKKNKTGTTKPAANSSRGTSEAEKRVPLHTPNTPGSSEVLETSSVFGSHTTY